jgi:hypothetical protein
MRNAKLLAGAAALAVSLLAPGTAHAVTFTESFAPLYPSGGEMKTDDKYGKFQRFRVGAFAAFWDFPNPLFDENNPSPLLTAEYFVTRNISIGGWWNRQDGDFGTAAARSIGFTRGGDYELTSWEVYVAYHFPDKPLTRGLSIQFGYSVGDLEIDFAGRTFDSFSGLKSVDFWLNKSQTIARPMFGGKPHPITLFGGVGYYPDGDAYWHGGSLIVGASFAINQHLSLTGSYWWVNLFDQNSGTDTIERFTVGLTGSF